MTLESRTSVVTTCYDVVIPSGLDLLIFTWGNTDAGCRPLVEHAMSRALVVDAYLLHAVGVGACVARLFEAFPPNKYGYT